MFMEQKSGTFNSVRELLFEIDIYCAKKNVTKGHLINTLFIALLTGDIKVERDLNRKLKVVGGVTDDVNSLYKIDLFDKQGNLLNPSNIELDYE